MLSAIKARARNNPEAISLLLPINTQQNSSRSNKFRGGSGKTRLEPENSKQNESNYQDNKNPEANSQKQKSEQAKESPQVSTKKGIRYHPPLKQVLRNNREASHS